MYSFSSSLPQQSHTPRADVVVSFSLKPGEITLKSFAADTRGEVLRYQERRSDVAN